VNAAKSHSNRRNAVSLPKKKMGSGSVAGERNQVAAGQILVARRDSFDPGALRIGP
jgi:hypothetical protein